MGRGGNLSPTRREFLESSAISGLSSVVLGRAVQVADDQHLACGTGPLATPIASREGQRFRALVTGRGGLAVRFGDREYRVGSSFSYQGAQLGWNHLSPVEATDRDAWRPRVSGGQSSDVTVVAQARDYRVTRTISVGDTKISVTDELLNISSSHVGILVRHCILSPGEPDRVLLGGAAEEEVGGPMKHFVKEVLRHLGPYPDEQIDNIPENPSVFISLADTHVGVLAEDTVSRLQFVASTRGRESVLALDHLALAPGERRVLRWTIYPFSGEADYFTFINRVRQDLRTNFTIPGPWAFFDIGRYWGLLSDPPRLREWIRAHRVRVVGFKPWVDYDNFNWRTGKVASRDDYRLLAQEARSAFQSVDPEIKCVGCMQNNLMSLPPDLAGRLFEALPADRRDPGIRAFSDRQMQIVRGQLASYSDSVVVDREGRHWYELYYHGPRQEPMIALAVYATASNRQGRYLMDQARFILETVGLDGVYVDQFNMAFRGESGLRYTYDRWDGVTADIDPLTGRIARRYGDLCLLGVELRIQLAEYILSRGAIMVANTHPAEAELQAYPIARFVEGSPEYLRLSKREGRKPLQSRTLCRAQLGSPVVLGVQQPERNFVDDPAGEYAGAVMRAIIACLRHGVVYYHFYLNDIGPCGWKGGVVDRLFPFTPSALHEGWVEGRERVASAISGTFPWRHAERPSVHRFDARGRAIASEHSVRTVAGGWEVDLRIRDWTEVAIIDSSKLGISFMPPDPGVVAAAACTPPTPPHVAAGGAKRIPNSSTSVGN